MALENYTIREDLFEGTFNISLKNRIIRKAADRTQALALLNQLHVQRIVQELTHFKQEIEQEVKYKIALTMKKVHLITLKAHIEKTIVSYNRRLCLAEIMEDMEQNLLSAIYEAGPMSNDLTTFRNGVESTILRFLELNAVKA